jgi:ribosomal protein S11
LLGALVPVSAASEGLVIDEDGGIALDPVTALTLDARPSDGFLFPVFSDRAPDINNVCAYSKNTAKPNVSLVQGLLECSFVRAAKSEREIFNDVLEAAAGTELDYTKIVEIDNKIAEIVAQTQNETELAIIDTMRLTRILSETGVSEETVKAVPAAFEKAAGETAFTAVNLVTKKVSLVTEGITVSISGDSAGRVRTQNMNGRKCLIIDLDDPTVTVNGIETNV